MDKSKVLKQIKHVSWLLGGWGTYACNLAINGIRDYTRKETVSGWLDAHIHLCRVDTYSPKYLPASLNFSEITDYPLEVKQEFVGVLHDGIAYFEKSLRTRMRNHIKRAIRIGTREMWAVCDTTPDINSRALKIGLELKNKFSSQIDIKIGCYPVFGFKNPFENPDRLNCLEECAQKADFIVGLPEKDEGTDKIGFKAHVNLLLEMAYRHKNIQQLHIHADQMNSAGQNDSLRIIECLEGLSPEKFKWFTAPGRPKIFLVHVISPSCYGPEKFSELAEKLALYNIGVICCPIAGISMRQLRSEVAPVHNSIARVIELMAHGVKVHFGTDNVNDIFVPSGQGLIPFELIAISNIARYYGTHILVKAAMGIDLSNSDRENLHRSLNEATAAYYRHQEALDEFKRKKPIVAF